jgi:ribosomal protein S18 acetylase RimI-like enzyme
VARYQSWSVPYPVERALDDIRAQLAFAGPVPGEWVQLAVEHGACWPATSRCTSTTPVSWLPSATRWIRPSRAGAWPIEAVGAVVDALLADGVLRVTAECDPRNHPSRRVLERLGFEREGLLRRHYRAPEGWVDEERWGLLAEDRAAWLARPQGRPAEVRLVELSERPRTYGRLSVFPTQEGRVATVWESYADALLPEADDGGGRLVPWFRGIEADGEPAGFVMCSEPTPTSPLPFLWRLLVDRRHQGRGIGESPRGPGDRPVPRHGPRQLLLDAQQLVVLGDPVRAGRGAGLDLAAVGGHGEVGDGGVLGLARAVRHDRGVAPLRVASSTVSRVSVSEPIWLTFTRIELPPRLDAAAEALGVGDEQVVADELDRSPSASVSSAQPSQSSSAMPSSMDTIG